VQEYRDFV
jgi:hypothetical protein